MTTKNSLLDTAVSRIAQPGLSSMLVMGGVTLIGAIALSGAAQTPRGEDGEAAGKAAKAVTKTAAKQIAARPSSAKPLVAKPSGTKTSGPKASSTAKTDEEIAAQVTLRRARELREQGADSMAERRLLFALELVPGWMPAQRELATLYTEQERWIEAAAAWRKVLAKIPAARRADSEARRQFNHARRHLSAFWHSRDIVELGADSDNFSSRATNPLLAGGSVLADAPVLDDNPVLAGGLAAAMEGRQDGLTTLRSLAKAQPRLGTSYGADARAAKKAIALLPSLPDPQPPLKAAKTTDSSTNAAILTPAGIKDGAKSAKQTSKKPFLVAASPRKARAPRTSAERQEAGRLALARGRQLAAQNVVGLAQVQFEQAVALIPNSLEAQITLARFQSKQAKTYQQWGEAMQSWRHVLFMQHKAGIAPAAGKDAKKAGEATAAKSRMAALAAEANREFRRARARQSALWNAHLAASARGITNLGQDSDNLLSSTSLKSLRSLAKLSPSTGAAPVNAGSASMQSGLNGPSDRSKTLRRAKPTTSFVFSMKVPASEESAAARAASIGYTREIPEYGKVEEVETVDNPKVVGKSEK